MSFHDPMNVRRADKIIALLIPNKWPFLVIGSRLRAVAVEISSVISTMVSASAEDRFASNNPVS
jgi:hypothetical protein